MYFDYVYSQSNLKSSKTTIMKWIFYSLVFLLIGSQMSAQDAGVKLVFGLS